MTVERWFPIQGETRPIWSEFGKPDMRVKTIAPTRIPWSVAEEAYRVYSAKYSTQQSLEQLAQRGGFGREELIWLLSGGAEEDLAGVVLP